MIDTFALVLGVILNFTFVQRVLRKIHIIVLYHLPQGLQETIHPYNFVAREGFKELLQTPAAKDNIPAVLPKVIDPLRTALVSCIFLLCSAGNYCSCPCCTFL